MELVVVDERGRITLPSKIRKKVKITKGSILSVDIRGDEIILRKVERVSEKFAGVFKVKGEVPDNLDEFIIEAVRKWWKKKRSM